MEKKPFTNWQAIGIGLKTGLIPIGLALLVFSLGGVGIFGMVFTVFFCVLGMPLCIAGALLGKYISGESKAAWIGGIVASALGSAIAYYLVFNTCWGMC